MNEEEKLRDCYRNSLILADEKKVSSIAFPNISTGAYGFPKEKAVEVALDEVKLYFLKNSNSSIREVVFVCYDDENFDIYTEMMK